MPENIKPPVWLVTPSPHSVCKSWYCVTCGDGGEFEHWDDEKSRAHVRRTGHEVAMLRTEIMQLIPVNTQPPG